jgi:hypothetical protein
MAVQEEVRLDNLAGGAVDELFQAALAQVIENTLDINTDAEAARSLTLTVKIVPVTTDRRTVNAIVQIKTSLAPANKVGTTLYFGKQGDRFVAVGDDPRQMDAFKEPAKWPAGVTASLKSAQES